jgi:hypothetical protein
MPSRKYRRSACTFISRKHCKYPCKFIKAPKVAHKGYCRTRLARFHNPKKNKTMKNTKTMKKVKSENPPKTVTVTEGPKPSTSMFPGIFGM